MRIFLKKTSIVIFFLFLVWIILSNSQTVSTNITMAFDLWLKRVFPTLFPMFVISNILIKFGLADFIGKLFAKLFKKLFKVNGTAAYVMIMSLISGTPSNAIFVKELYQNNYLSNKEASKILSFTFFASPIFIYAFLGVILDYNQAMIFKIIFTCYFTNIIIGLLFRNLYSEEKQNKRMPNSKFSSFSEVFTDSIKKAMNNMIMILGTISFFIMISSLVNEVFNLNILANAFVKGFLELTQGLNSLITLNISLKIKGIISAIFISFGGLSIHMQIKSIISDTPISYKLFFVARIIHSLITTGLLLLIL